MKPKFNIYDYLIVFLISIVALGEIFQLVKFIGLAAIIYVFANFDKEYFKGYKDIKMFLIAFMIFNFLSALWSIDMYLWKKNLINLISLSFDFMLLITFAAKAKNPVRSVINGWISLVLLTFPVAFWEFYSNLHISSNYADGGIRLQKTFASVTFGNLNTYTTLLCLALPFIASLIFAKIKLSARIIVLVVVIGIIYIVLMNSSRGGIISLVAMGGVLLHYYWKYLRTSFWGLLIIIVSGVLAFYYFDIATQQFEQRIASRGDLFADDGRSNMLEYGFRIFLKSPLGIGVGNIAYHYIQFPTGGLLIPHNMFMEFLLYGGLFFFVIFIIWLFRTYIRGFKSNSKVIRFIFHASAFSLIPVSVVNSGFFFIPYIWIFLASIYVISNSKIYDDRLV